jgi:hypothetical protein
MDTATAARSQAEADYYGVKELRQEGMGGLGRTERIGMQSRKQKEKSILLEYAIPTMRILHDVKHVDFLAYHTQSNKKIGSMGCEL